MANQDSSASPPGRMRSEPLSVDDHVRTACSDLHLLHGIFLALRLQGTCKKKYKAKVRIYGLESSERQSLVMLGLENETLSKQGRDVNLSSTKTLSVVTCIFLVPSPYITETRFRIPSSTDQGAR